MSILDDYVDQVLEATAEHDRFSAFTCESKPMSVAVALVRFVLTLVAFPVVDVGIAARRALSAYAATDLSGAAVLLQQRHFCDSVQSEHLLASIQVSQRSGLDRTAVLREDVEMLNTHESAAVRGIAYRICTEQSWDWREVTSEPASPTIVLPNVAPHDANDSVIGQERISEVIAGLAISWCTGRTWIALSN